MNIIKITKVTVIFVSLACSAASSAQLGSLKFLGKSMGGNDTAASENSGEVVKNARNSLQSFVSAKIGLIEAMGGSEQLAAQKKILEGIKQGDAAASKKELETIVSLDKATGDMINRKAAENAQLDAKNKSIASKSMLEYVRGLVSAKKLVSSVSNLSKNPMSLISNLGSVTYLAKELPTIISSGSRTTSTLFKYLNSNGVDTKAATKAAADLGT